MLAAATELFTFMSLVGELTAGCQFPGMIWRFAPSAPIEATSWWSWTVQGFRLRPFVDVAGPVSILALLTFKRPPDFTPRVT